MNTKIFVTEDDDNIRELIKIALEGYGYRVYAYESAEEALEAMDQTEPDLAIFDIMLPGIEGTEAVKKIRSEYRNPDLPIIMLTAKDSELDKIIGLDMGADDYVTKPFSVLELMARIRSLLRRANASGKADSGSLTMGALTINANTGEVLADGERITLTLKEFELLKYLVENNHRVVSRNELLNKIWGYEYTGETRTVDIHIRTLRQKLGKYCEYIKTVRGMGYRATTD